MDGELLKKLWPVFVEEAREHLQQIGAGVLEMEKRPGAALLESVRRTAHSLKGSAASLGLEDLEKLAHALEDALAGNRGNDRLGAQIVETMLAAVEAGEQALRAGDAGAHPDVPKLDAHVAALQRAASGAKPQAAPAPSEPSPLDQIWPVFKSEAEEQLAKIRAALQAASGRPGGAPEDAAGLQRLAASLKSSAGVLGLREMERLAGLLEIGLGEAARAGGLEERKLSSLRSWLDSLGLAMQRTDASVGGAPVAAAPPPPPASTTPPPFTGESLANIFRREADEALGAMGEALTRLCSPLKPEERPPLVEEALRRAHNLKGSAAAVGAAAVAETAALVHGALAKMREPGREASKAAAMIAGALVDMKQAVRAFSVPSEPAPAAPAPKPDAAPAQTPTPVPSASPAAAGGAVDRQIRVSVKTLESIGRQIEGLTLTRARQERRARDLQSQAASVQEAVVLCERAVSELRAMNLEGPRGFVEDTVQRLRLQQRGLVRLAQESMREAEQLRLTGMVVREDLRDLRMVPASTALEPLRRTVREAAGRCGKQVELVLEGGDVRLDRRILDELKDPLMHLVRNAVDHGLESPEARRAAGKPPSGRLTIQVERRGGRLGLIVADDGAGLDLKKIRAIAVKRALLSAQAADQLSDAEATRLIFKAGFSTAEQVTALSGRGVGLDVVQEVAIRLRGSVDVFSAPGRGTRFVLDLPLSLAATLAVVVRAGGELAALAYEAVERILRLTKQELGTVAGHASVDVEGMQVPFASLAQVLDLAPGRLPLEGNKAQPAMLLEAGGQRVVFAIDEVVGQQEVVIHSLGKHLSRVAHLGGAAVLEDGRVVSVLNAHELVRLARPMARGRDRDQGRTRILVADDSLTTRSAMKAVLEIAGYSVVPAGDGEEALRLLQDTPCALVVTDVQMPRMDGLSLTRKLKGDPRYASLPVIVVTSLDAAADRAAGLEAGADGYLVKREVERGKLLELVKQLLPEGD